MSRNEEFSQGTSGGRHKKETIAVRGGLVVACAHCSWTDMVRHRGEANYAYDVHVAKSRGQEVPSKWDESGYPLKKYRI